MENFKNYYKFPLHVDNGKYVRTIDNKTALVFTARLKNDVIQDIVDKLNGECNKSSLPEWYIKNETEVWFNNTRIMFVKGWGMLRRKNRNGCYNLPEEEAIKIQDEFAKYVVNTLNS